MLSVRLLYFLNTHFVPRFNFDSLATLFGVQMYECGFEIMLLISMANMIR